MPQYKYRARTSDARITAGLIEATNEEEAQLALAERNLQPLTLEPYKGIDVVQKRALGFLNRVTAKDLVVLSRTLSVMVSASVPIPEAVRDIAKQTQNPSLRSVMLDVANEIEGGARLSDGLERHPNVFSSFFINMVRSGETTGQLSEVLAYLADQQEKDYDLLAKIKGAMIYPAFIIGTMGAMGFVMMTFVVPKLVSVLKEANVPLPITTRMLIATSGFMQSYWWLIILMAIASTIGFRAWIATPSGRYAWDTVKIRVPGFGSLFQRVYVVRFARSLSTLVKGGVDVVSALEIVASVIGNEVWKRMVHEAIQEVNDGNSMVTAFQRHTFVPAMMNQMIAVGEGTGRTQEILLRVSDFYSREIDNQVSNLTKLIEPIVIIILGIGVGILVSAILLPLYQLSSGTGV